MMEDNAPEGSKRPRLDSFASTSHQMQHQHQHQQHPPPPPPPIPPQHQHHLPQHRQYPPHQQTRHPPPSQPPEAPLPLQATTNAFVLAPPNAYIQPPPPSPYDTSHDHRSASDAIPPTYAHSHSGYSTPARDSRSFPLEATTFARPSSISLATARPQDDVHLATTTAALRPLNPDTDPQQPYPHPHVDAGPPRFLPHEASANGQYHTVTMSVHPDPSQPPSAGSHVGYVESPTGQAPLYSPQYTHPGQREAYPSGPPPVRKNTRALQACDTCRTRKAKCDEGKPKCGFCISNDQDCKYKDIPAPKADRAQRELMDQLRDLATQQSRFTDTTNRDIGALNREIGALNHRYEQQSEVLSDISGMLHKLSGSSASTTIKLPAASRPHEFLEPSRVSQTRLSNPTEPELPADDEEANVDGSRPGEADPAIKLDHTTGAHRLLRWPKIRAMLKTKPNEDFVMQNEERKGCLRFYAKGYGRDSWDGGASPSSSSSGRGDTPPGADYWGVNMGAPRMENRPVGYDHPGGLTPEGGLRIDLPTMTRLRESYLRHIHVLHPFLDKTRLKRMFDRVYFENCIDLNKRRDFIPTWPPPQRLEPLAGSKRKYSMDSAASPASDIAPQGPVRTGTDQFLERRVSTAIVLIVMALGKICEHHGPLPGPVTEEPTRHALGPPPPLSLQQPHHHLHHPPPSSTSIAAHSPATMQSPLHRPSPTTSSASLYPSTTTTTSSPMSEQRTWLDPTATTTTSSVPSGDKNVDVIPGLAYFTAAVEILGALQSGNELGHVQARLLAGLYTSQLAFTLDSYKWIQTACQSCYFLIRDRILGREEKRNSQRADMIKFAYWTCLQLENDILAELDLLPSGIEQPGRTIPFPKGVGGDLSDASEGAVDGRVVSYYSSQIVLRTTLDKVQKMLYPPAMGKAPPASTVSVVSRNQAEKMLEEWRNVLPAFMRWRDNDPPSKDILEARLRAKYYGALYIIHRPFLYFALHADSWPAESGTDHSRDTSMPPPGGMSGSASGPEIPSKEEVMRSVRLCVDAARWSTLAFDGIIDRDHRLIVTNIFGTAHAQFSNMLVLSATYHSHLCHYIARDDLLRLLNRTLCFLNSLAPLSATLAQDVRILVDVKEGITNLREPIPTFNDLLPGHGEMDMGMDLSTSGAPATALSMGVDVVGEHPATSSFTSSHSG